LGVKQGWCLSPIIFKLYSEYLTKDALDRFGISELGQVTRCVKYADDPVLLPKEKRCYRV